MTDPATWLAGLACITGCYFAACHAALRTFTRSKLAELLEENGRDDQLEPLLSRTAALLVLTGTLRTAANLVVLLAVLSEIGKSLPDASLLTRYLLSFLITGSLVSVFAVAIPASWARHQPEKLLAKSVRFLGLLLYLFAPLTAVLLWFDPIVRRISGGDDTTTPDQVLTEELMSVVEQHKESTGVDQVQKQMIEALVELPTTTADQIMTPRTDVQGIEINATLENVKAAILEAGHSRIPVYDGDLDHIVGILYAKDMIKFLGNDQPFNLRDLLRDALMVPQTKPVGQLLAEFKAKKVHMAIVLDEYGGTAGLVTIEDVLEEIVGEIQDEYEPTDDQPHIRRIDDHTLEVDARVYVDDLNDELDLKLPEDADYDTVGGFVFSTLGRIPQAGEQFEYNHVTVTVTAAERTKVSRVRIQEPAPAEPVHHGDPKP